ncbi:ATP-binding cassette, subfamily C [Actinopolymorpha cephalotaxi]|uniref:ATP-binding cassette subfamily C protein n=1 Tax=Actinopolymorpha cephalotaxi TaxID=504797 RepID=A0A1I2ZU87_9ACTN|nr:ABC transporter ATP-binding protein [Actinopolymorpha cephalotaxi]NYH84163.1 ATP-binding cassette subfamily C protein [Actinopolymorpha cephalotaxi]SFH41175.1 ATP-binding cassette, subfamily C [Actinopolymorpha cephalotaxi]
MTASVVPATTDAGHLPVATAAAVRRSTVSLVRREPLAFGLVVGLNVLATSAGLAGPFLLGRIVNSVGRGADVAGIDRLAALIVVFAALQFVLTRYARLIAVRLGERLSAHIREQFLERVLTLPARIVEKASLGDLSARAGGDVSAVSATMRMAIPDVFIAVIQTLMILVAVAVVSPLLGLCSVIGLSGIWFAARWYLRRARSAYLSMGAANSTMAEVLATTAAGARTVEALSLQRERLHASLAAIERARGTRLRALRLRTVLYSIVDVSYVLPLVGALLVGGVLYERGAVSLGSIVAVALYLRQLQGPIDVLEIWIDQLQSSAASFARLEGVADLAAPQDGAPPEPAHDRVEIRGVRFAYDGRPDVLHGIDLDLRPGERLAVVGASGAGKSTVARLVAGIDEPRTGSVTVGGVPVSQLSVAQLRRQIVLVTQDHHVFRGTIRDNLRIASVASGDAELRAALEAVGATWFHDLPDGLDTELGSELVRLDAGQAQQLSLARVVLADPHTVILDEATAMLDPTTARRAERALSAVLSGRSVLAIAHRLHTAHDADRVAVMDSGRIIEIGTHGELIEQGGTYAALWSTWHGTPRAEPRVDASG